MPGDLVGRSLSHARAELTQLGLHVALAPGSAGGPDAIVTTTLPTAGTQIARGDTVILTTVPITSTTTEASATPSASPTADATPHGNGIRVLANTAAADRMTHQGSVVSTT